MDDSDLPEVQHRPKGWLVEIYIRYIAEGNTVRPSHQKPNTNENPFVSYTNVRVVKLDV
jgi:IMP cyclohydrolase